MSTDYLDMNPDHVASYLRRHANFLADYPDLALTLVMPREAGAATSLTNYQLEILREKNRALSGRLKDLVTVAEENQALVGRVHQLALRLLRAGNFRESVLAVAASLREDFHTDLVRVCLSGMPRLMLDEPWLLEVDATDAGLVVFAEFRRRREPLCGRLRPDKLDFLFGELAPEVASAVLLPFGDAGFLGIGSTDANRFHPGMGTVFLRQISELIETALVVVAGR
ncbi:MAG: hypothetical protein AMXMBFR25_05780 [Lysobacterales bacterium]|nr:hypothetical protein [Xanthomonadales bacterium]